MGMPAFFYLVYILLYRPPGGTAAALSGTRGNDLLHG
jgi:hypothetical protein